MTEPVWLLRDVVVVIQNILIAQHGGPEGIRDQALLESALARPRQKFAYEPESTLFDLAASYGFGLVRNHPFVDGNKRIALAASATFLSLNGFELNAPEPEAVVMIRQLAAGDVSEAGFAAWLKDRSIPT